MLWGVLQKAEPAMDFPVPNDPTSVRPDGLVRLTNALMDRIEQLLRRCRDADVTFVPVDPYAVDHAAATLEEANQAWTLGHIIVHLTATAEESAALAAEQARGVSNHGRSRFEVPWETVTTVGQCRARLAESRRMCLASLQMWPDQPHLDTTYIPWEDGPVMGPNERYLLGLQHAVDHLEQIREVADQALTARLQKTFVGRWRNRLRGRQGVAAAPSK